MRKILSVVLALAIMMTVVSSMAFAATATNTYTGIVPTAGDTKTTTISDLGNGVYGVVMSVASDTYPGFNIDLNGSDSKVYNKTTDSGYLVLSYTVDFKTAPTGNIIVRPARNSSAANLTVSSALAAGVYKFSYIYDIANAKIYPYIDGVAGTSATINLASTNNYGAHRFMPTIKNLSVSNTVLMEVSGIKTEEYAAGTGVLAELQAAIVANDTPQAPEHPGGSEVIENLVPTSISNSTVSGNTVSLTFAESTAASSAYGKFAFNFGEDIKFDQSAAAAEVDYIRFHATLSSDVPTANLFLRPHNSGTQLAGTNALCQLKNANTAYEIDMIVDLATKTFDYYVNGVHIALRTNTTTGTSINQARFWLYTTPGLTTNVTCSNAYVEKYYAKNPVYASYAALKAACNTQEVDLDYAVATYDSTEEKYVVSAQIFDFDYDNHYNIVAGYDSLGNLVFAQEYWPGLCGTNSNIEGVSQVASMKAFSWDAATLRPLMSVQNVTVNN